MSADLTPEGVRALIAEAKEFAALPVETERRRDLVRRLAAALSASLPREDADLDAIEARYPQPFNITRLSELKTGFRQAVRDIRALLARVRTAEAERDAARKAALTEALDAIAESAPSMDEEHQQAHAAYMAVGALLGADFPFPASRPETEEKS